jgi:hypothetical protein
MAEEKPRLEIVNDKPDLAAGNVFDDLDALRKASKLTVKRQTVLVNVSVGKPANNSFFRAHPTWYLEDSTIVKDNGTGDIYYILPAMRDHPKLAPRLRWVWLTAIAIWPADIMQIWPVPILGGGREFKPWRSARVAYELAREKWVQIVWNETTSDYTVETAEGIDHQPYWPDKTFNELLKLGFDGKIIDSEDHPYVRQLRGLID